MHNADQQSPSENTEVNLNAIAQLPDTTWIAGGQEAKATFQPSAL